ncbi:MAG: hypothetical protein ACLFQO_00005, partial [Cyclobacteriaceae bacterium]
MQREIREKLQAIFAKVVLKQRGGELLLISVIRYFIISTLLQQSVNRPQRPETVLKLIQDRL